jgi:hypothetical protein
MFESCHKFSTPSLITVVQNANLALELAIKLCFYDINYPFPIKIPTQQSLCYQFCEMPIFMSPIRLILAISVCMDKTLKLRKFKSLIHRAPLCFKTFPQLS